MQFNNKYNIIGIGLVIKRGKFGLPENEETLDRDKRFVDRLNRVVDKYISTVDEFSFYTV